VEGQQSLAGAKSAVAVDQQEWVLMPAPAIVDKSLFAAAQEQLRENRSRARVGLRRPGYLLQGLACCALCGYAFYGKTTRQRGRGHRMRDFQYYRCSGTDPYRFGGERICSNTQIRADKLEAALWNYVCEIIKNPGNLEERLCRRDTAPRAVFSEDVDALNAQRQRLQHGIERLIDTLAEGLIDRDQFTSRMERAKTRLTDLDAKIASHAADQDRRAHIHLAMRRLTELSRSLQAELKKANWATKREIIRAVVQRIEIGPTNIAVVFRLPTETNTRGVEPIVVKLSRA
jgi:site-specific DNA recombinase